MSFYTFTTANLTTAADRRRRPAVSAGQLARALGCFLVALLALVFVADRGHAAQDGFHGFVESVWVQAHHRGVSRATFDRAFADVTPDPDVLAKTHRQAEFVKPISDYVASAGRTRRASRPVAGAGPLRAGWPVA